LRKKYDDVKAGLTIGQHSVPSTVAEEKSYNPFMRLHSLAIRERLGLTADASNVEVMATLRQMKNNWKG